MIEYGVVCKKVDPAPVLDAVRFEFECVFSCRAGARLGQVLRHVSSDLADGEALPLERFIYRGCVSEVAL